MKERCPNAKEIGKAVLREHKIGFTRHSKTWECGTADILVSPADEVWGVLYSITETDLESLDFYEGVNRNAYKRTSLTVDLCRISEDFFEDIQKFWEDPDKKDGLINDFEKNYVYYEPKEAFVYEVVEKDLSLHPSTEYLDVMLDAAFENHFPGGYVQQLSRFGKRDVEKKSQKGIDYLLLLRDIVLQSNWPNEVSKEPEWGGAELVITGDPQRKSTLAENHPEDLVILTPHWQKLSWLVRNIYHHPSMNWQINYFNKYAILSVLGNAINEHQNEFPSDKDEKGICKALIIRAYEILTH
jgi:hypothetical protein